MDTKEFHPLIPFLPDNARILMAGSFPPPQSRWCMDWYYPNFQNDMWRIFGYIFTRDKNHFVDIEKKMFKKDLIVEFCSNIGLALSDTGEEALRLKGNASDKFLQVVKPRDFSVLLDAIPQCHTVVLTGEKAVETLGAVAGFSNIPVGEFVTTPNLADRDIKIWRMPSSSRAYPKSIEWKADFYRRPLIDAGIIRQ